MPFVYPCGPSECTLDVRSDTRFLDWLAGFIAGEGCFYIGNDRAHYAPVFSICLRDDDGAILDEAQQRLGLGRRYQLIANGTSKPQAMWSISGKAEQQAFVELLDDHPLRARKADDYAIWREAVLERNGANRREVLAHLRDKLRAARSYEPMEIPDAPFDGQLALAA